MPLFAPPTVVELPAIADPERYPVISLRQARYYAPRAAVGRSVLKIGGTYRTVANPTQAQLESCDLVTWPDGTRSPEFYLGGHIYQVTSAVGTALTTAGFTVTGDVTDTELTWGGLSDRYWGEVHGTTWDRISN